MMSITWKDTMDPTVSEDEGKQEPSYKVSDKVSLREQLVVTNQEGEVHWEKGLWPRDPFHIARVLVTGLIL